MSHLPHLNSPPSRRGGGLVVWVATGVVVFSVLSALTLVVLVRSAPPSTSASVPVSTAAPAPDRSVSPAPHSSPAPTASTSGRDRLSRNVLTRVQLGETTCPDVRLQRGSVQEDALAGYLQSLVDCLMAVHEAPFGAAGVNLQPPALATASEMERSSCVLSTEEPGDWAGLYCGANNTIYYRTDLAPDDPLHYVEVIAHEFGHHLQHQTGMLAIVAREQRATRTEPNGGARAQELSRRLELQAECLTGLLVGPEGPLAVRAPEFGDFLASRAAVPPDWAATHGTGRAQTRWFKAGAGASGSDRLSACNTFSAPADLVD
ncbi:neutral zinc metallopeptidase [Granulicoccus sp. GXG6511]|uniref:neutral zinc metallopeptidase n=1 Tax=Granulicoccus sp. GXG6511 TaxID=3381351 RepID=UPI003D7C5DC8